jgi:hypothetical protein
VQYFPSQLTNSIPPRWRTRDRAPTA